jgi:integrase
VTAVRNHQRGKSKHIDVRGGKGRRIRNRVGRGEYPGIFEGDATPFSIYASAWLERKKATLARSTYGDYLSIWNRHVLPHFGNVPLSQVTWRDVEEFLGKLVDISAKRKNNILVPLKCLFNDATRRGDIEEPPTEHIRRFRETKPYADPFSFPEMRRFLDHVDPRYGAYFTTAFLTGMRPNEMIALKWTSVDFGMRCITVREGRVLGVEGPPKTMSSCRDVDLLDPLLEVLCRHRQASRGDPGHVFANRHGNPLEVNNLRNRVWYPTLIKAGLRKRTMYQTRHTFASLMLSHGEDPLWVARMLGHTGLDMIFKHYGKFIRNRSRKDGGRFLEGLREAEAAPDGKTGIRV